MTRPAGGGQKHERPAAVRPRSETRTTGGGQNTNELNGSGSVRNSRPSAATAPIPSRYTTLALRGGGHRDIEAGIQWEALAQPITLATADLQEGIRAAREKRPPVFRGV